MVCVKEARAVGGGGQITYTKSQSKSGEEQLSEAVVHLRPPSPVH